MKNTFFVLAALLTASGSILAGCDAGGNSDGPQGGSSGTTTDYPCQGWNLQVVVTTPVEALKMCVGWSASKFYPTNAACVADLSKTLTKDKAQAECSPSVSMTEAECSDWEHDFVDSVGVNHAYVYATPPGSYYQKLTNFGVAPPAKPCPTDGTAHPSRPVCDGEGEFVACYGRSNCY